jgi:hypothetical protein
LVGHFLSCRERFRLRVMEGWRANDRFNHRLEYGNLWHLMEESLAKAGGEGVLCEDNETSLALTTAVSSARLYAEQLCRRYPLEQQEINKWYNVAKVQFPLYARHWADHQEKERVVHLEQEGVFDVPYHLPSGRTVRLRGKRDGVDLVGERSAARVYLFETKTKGDVNESRMKRQLTWDLQTMFYLTALTSDRSKVWPAQVAGVRYNVIRRPLSGGKGSIVQHKARGGKPGESAQAYYERLGKVIASDPGHFFMRWRVEVGAHDVVAFCKYTLDPVLEEMCDWYKYTVAPDDNKPTVRTNYSCHWRHPYGVDNPIDEGYGTDVEAMLETGSTAGLTRVNVLFPELEVADQ